MTEAKQHSRLSPSSSYQWVKCPASIGLQELYPELDNEEAEAGEASHWVASTCLTMRDIKPDMLVGQEAPNGVKVSLEIAEAAEVYVNDVLSLATNRGLFTGLRIEEPVHIPRVHPDCWGTPDASAFDSNQGTLYIWDYKYGYGIVEAYENWQGICYALGALDRIVNCGNPNAVQLEQFATIEIRIVQPRPYHKEGPVRPWRIPATELRGYANILHMSAHAALQENTNTVSGPHCRYCSARHVCPAAQKAAMFAVDVIDQSTPQELDNFALGPEITVLRRAKEMVEWRLAAIESQALTLIRQGKMIPGYTAEAGQGRQVWNRPKTEVVTLGELCGIDLRKPVDVITPKQAIDSGIDSNIVNSYSEVSKKGLRLVSDQNLARKVFK